MTRHPTRADAARGAVSTLVPCATAAIAIAPVRVVRDFA